MVNSVWLVEKNREPYILEKITLQLGLIPWWSSARIWHFQLVLELNYVESLLTWGEVGQGKMRRVSIG